MQTKPPGVMQRRLWLVCGPTEVLTCRMVRESHFANQPGEDILVLYGQTISMPAHLRRETLDHAAAFWTSAIDLVDETNELSTAVTPTPAKILDQVGPGVTHIMTHTLDKVFERLVFDAYPDARIVFFDNGLASHLNKGVEEASGVKLKAATVRAGDLRRVEKAHLTFGHYIPAPDYMSALNVGGFDRHIALGVLAEHRLHDLSIPDGASVHLVLGTSFYRTNKISYEEERGVYRERVEDLLADLDAFVLYKEHPRANREPFMESEGRIKVIGSTLPVETIPLKVPVRTASSVSSTALLYLDWLFGVRPVVIDTPAKLEEKFEHVALLRRSLALGVA